MPRRSRGSRSRRSRKLGSNPGRVEPGTDGRSRFLRGAVQSEALGAPFRGVSLVGVDDVTGRAQGVRYDDHSPALYPYEGTLTEGGAGPAGGNLQ